MPAICLGGRTRPIARSEYFFCVSQSARGELFFETGRRTLGDQPRSAYHTRYALDLGARMSNKTAEASAVMWCGNPNKWFGSGSMESYVADASRYVYWATPPRQCRHNDITVGKRAYIWRTVSTAGPRGIVAIGAVAESPRQLSPSSRHLFARPDRLGLGEEAASSGWKTGISINEVRLKTQMGMLAAEELERIDPRLNVLRNPRGTVYRVNAEQERQIEALWESKRT